MARDPYNPTATVEPTTGGTPYLNIPTQPGEFGGLIAGAEQRASSDIAQSANEAAQTALALQNRQNQIVSDGAFNQYQSKLLDLTAGNPTTGTKGYFALQGKDALDAYPDASKQIEDTRTQISGSLNDAQRLQFEESSRRLQMYTLDSMRNHFIQQQSVYGATVSQATQQNAERAIGVNVNSDQAFNDNLFQMRGGAVRELQNKGMGGDPDVLHDAVETATQKAIVARVQAFQGVDPIGGAAKAMAWLQNGQIPDTPIPGQPQTFSSVASHLEPNVLDALVRPLRAVLKNQQGDVMLGQLFQGGVPTTPGGAAPGPIAAALRGTEASGATEVSDKGAAGTYQVTPPFFQKYAQPGENFNNETDREAVAKRGIDSLTQQYNGDAARVAVAYFSGEGNVAPAGSPTPWKADLSDGHTLTSQYVARFQSKLGAAPIAAPGASGNEGEATPQGWKMPDWSALEQRALQMTQGDDEGRTILLSKLAQTRQRIEMATATERSDLEHTMPDLTKAALAGLPVTVPIDRIRAVYPPDQADRIVTQFGVAQGAGQILAGVKWASPEQVQGTLTDLTTGIGTVSDTLRARLGSARGEGTVTTPEGPGQPAAVTETPELFGMRTRIASMAVDQIRARQEALNKDPGGYVLQEPTLANMGKALDPKTPDNPTAPTAGAKGYGAFARASLALQDHLGVLSAAQHVLSAPQAQSMAAALEAPGVDVKGQLDSLKNEWGAEAWPKVFGDMVTLGKLPAMYQGVAVLDDPKDAALLARAIGEGARSGKGWDDLLGNAGGKQVSVTLRDAVRNNTTVQTLERSLTSSGASAAQADQMLSAIDTLAYAKQFYNQDPAAAANAVKAFTDKYFFLGDARIPTGQAPAVTANAGALLTGPTLDHVPLPAGFTEGTPDDLRHNPTALTRADYLQSIRANPTWITSPRGDALWLMDNQARVVRDAKGAPIAVPFNQPGPVSPPGPAAAAMTPPAMLPP